MSMCKSISRSRKKRKFINLCKYAAISSIYIIEESKAVLRVNVKKKKVKREEVE